MGPLPQEFPAPASVVAAPTKTRGALRLVTLLLAALFLISAFLNLGIRIPLGFADLSFSSPSAPIAEFEVLIGAFLLASSLLSQLYVCGGALLLTTVGTTEGMLSPDVQGLARSLHESMIPFVVAGYVLVALEASSAYRTRGRKDAGRTSLELVAALQFFVGGLVTLGGAAFARGGTYPVGTALGLVHLAVGLAALLGGYAVLRRKPWSKKFLVAINVVTIAYSALAESLAEIYAYLPPGINDALIGTIVAILVSGAIIYLLVEKTDSLPGSRGRLIGRVTTSRENFSRVETVSDPASDSENENPRRSGWGSINPLSC